MSASLVPILASKIPEYVRESYPNFVSFIKDYFGSLEQDEGFLRIIQDWRQNMEPSNNVEPYVTAILRDMGFESGQNLQPSKSLMIHLMRDFFLARGSEGSFKFLFRALFNESVEVRYPREEMLIPSYAAYGTRHFIYTSALNRGSITFDSTIQYIQKNGGTLTGSISEAVAAIDNISIIFGEGTPYLQIEVLQPSIEFEINEPVTILGDQGSFVETVKPILDINITDGGSRYEPGDAIQVTGAKIQGTARVKTTAKGGISDIIVSSPGTGYIVGDRISASSLDDGSGFSGYVTEVGAAGDILSAKVSSQGYNYDSIPTLLINSTSGSGGIVQAASTHIGAISIIQVSEPFIDLDIPTFTITSANGSGAILNAVEKSRWETSNWENNRGFIGENSTLIDSDKYQQFSYTLVSSIPASEYKDFVNEMLHPVGYVRTGSFEISSHSLLGAFGSEFIAVTPVVYEFNHTLNLSFVSSFDISYRESDNIVDHLGENIVTADEIDLIAAL